jgi:hypothetical protein
MCDFCIRGGGGYATTTNAPPDGASTLADLSAAIDTLNALERLERQRLLDLAATGARDETIATVAIGQALSRWPSPPPPGSQGWGVTRAELGRAVVEALRLCGRLPKIETEGETR